MRRRHLPKLWLMTDERMGEELWNALARLPRGAGVVFRHHATPTRERQRLFARVVQLARRRALLVVRAGGQEMAGEDGQHNPRWMNRRRRRGSLVTASVHDRRELTKAARIGADAVFVSPVFATASHPGGRALGVVRMGLLARGAKVPVIALGGMNKRRFRQLRGLGLYGWAGIDAWMRPDAANPRR